MEQKAGRPVGTGHPFTTQKEKRIAPLIIKMSKDFSGCMNDRECMEVLGIARNTYYRYKRNLKQIAG